jgi:HPt (histidine-containing phosphotransfer) domain-containing protein
VSEQNQIDLAALDALSEMVGGDPAFVAEMIDTFLEESPALLDTMRSASDGQDSVELRRASHSLKANSATFGAKWLAELCARIEEHAKVGEIDASLPLIEQAVESYREVESELKLARPEV